MSIERRPVTAAFTALLASATGKPVEVSKAPTDPTNDQIVVAPPYAIVYPLSGGDFWGPMYANPEDSADFVYQVTSVGLRDDQCQWMADKVREAVTGRDNQGHFAHSLSITGLTVADRVSDGGPGTVTLNGRIYSVPDSYIIRVVPAS